MKNIKIIARLIGTAAFIASLTIGGITQAATLSSGDLIKGPMDTVYYYAANGKRLVFPTDKTYKTWYADFSSIKNLSSDELAAISLGGNVTYRPGIKLVKVTTDPKVYAVSKGGILRWVKTENLATLLYGADWNTKIDDVPDAYFTNYQIGTPIANASDYSPTTESSIVTTINIDKGLTTASTTTPTPTPTPTTTVNYNFDVSKTTVQAGDVVTLIASVSDGSEISLIELFFDGMLIKYCNAVSCSGETQIPLSGTKTNYQAQAKFHRLNGEVTTQEKTITIQSNGSELVTVKTGQAQIIPGQLASVSVEADPGIAVLRIDIYVDGANIKACATGARLCQWSDVLQGSINSVHPVYGKVTDTLGRTYTSKIMNITLSTNDSPSVTVTPAKSSIYSGEYIDITVTATDNDGISWIEVMSNGAVLKHCDSATPCTVTTGPWNTAGATISFSGRAQDTKSMIGSGDIVNVFITNPIQ